MDALHVLFKERVVSLSSKTALPEQIVQCHDHHTTRSIGVCNRSHVAIKVQEKTRVVTTRGLERPCGIYYTRLKYLG